MTTASLRSKVIIGVVLIVACMATAYFYTIPQHSAEKAAADQLTTQNQKNDQLKQSLASIQGFTDSYNANQKEVALANAALPRKALDSASLLNDFGNLAQAAGVVLGDMQIADSSNNSSVPQPVVTNAIAVSQVTFTASGSYPSFKDFIMRLENNLPIIDLQDISLKVGDNGDAQYQVQLKTYYQQ